MRRLAITILLLMIISIINNVAEAFDDAISHRDITIEAVKNSVLKLKSYLSQNLGPDFSREYESVIKNKKVIDWIKDGAIVEDHPNCRASNHFHDPTKTWDSSAMSDEPFWLDVVCSGWKPWYSTVTWATGFLYQDGVQVRRNHQDMGWDNAREYFYSALTSTTSADRETNFAKTFQSVGQVMHLLQDMAVPAHVRNDFA